MDFMITSLSFLLILVSQCLGFWHHKEPDGKSKWHILYRPSCNGTRQSPVNIDTDSVILDRSLLSFSYKHYNKPINYATLYNNGHTVQLELGSYQDNSIQISSGGLPNAYIFEQFHLHWGKTSERGSEHTIDDVEYPGELHLVHFSKIYKSLTEAVSHRNGLAVLGMIFELSDQDNPKLDKLLSYFGKIKYKHDLTLVKDGIQLDAFLPEETDVYYRYEGSLTTPYCDESVIWTVFHRRIPISENQIKKFRELSEGNSSSPFVPLDDNYRDIKPLNDRKIKLSKTPQTSGSESVYRSMYR